MKMGKEFYENAKRLQLMVLCGCNLTRAQAEIVRFAQVNYHWRRVTPIVR